MEEKDVKAAAEAPKTEFKGAQDLALNQRGRTLLVSAAAGSGKTTVLTQRVINILANEGGDISRFLIVTFTRAAAGELRSRISDALTKELALHVNDEALSAHLSEQLTRLGGARISTIDSFYLDLVKAHFQATDLPPTFRLADDTELEPLRREVMDEAVDAMFETEPEFGRISDIFCNLRQESSLSEALISVQQKLNKYPEGIDILLRSANEIESGAADILHTKFGKIWKNTLERYAKFGVSLMEKAIKLMLADPNSKKLKDKYETIYREIHERCQGVLDGIATNDYDKIRRESSSPLGSFERGTPKAEPDFASLRALVTDFRDAWKKDIIPLGAYSPEEIADSAAESAEILRLLHCTLRKYNEQYRAIKRQREIAEFSDISRAAYDLLVDKSGAPTPLARELSKDFDAIYIDEYQDVDAMQDATFRAIATPTNRFMVGDIKQSIYRFRGAQPAVFAGYRKNFTKLEKITPGNEEALIFMSDCFRCDQTVIDFSNAVSGFLFSRNADSIGYEPKDDLHFAKKRDRIVNPESKCRVMILDRHKDSDEEDEESPAALAVEAKLIATEISKLLKDGQKVDGTPITPKDIAVLMRSSSLAKPLAKELSARFIPTNDTSQQRFFENPEILCMYSLLACIDNPFRDIYLAATLRSPFFGFTLEELVTIRDPEDRALSLYESLQKAASNPDLSPELSQKIADFSTRLATYRQKANALPVDKLIRFLFKDTGVMAFAGYEEKENGTLVRKGNLRRLYEYARTFEAGGFKGLYQFIRYVDNIMQNGTKMPAPDGEPNAVSLITIHHSKGLQYPVCFVSGTGSILNSDDLKPQLLSEEHLGCATKLCNAGPFSRTDTFFRKALAIEIQRQNREEEMRVLYVAMTRAKERLIVTGAPRGQAANLLKRAARHALPDAELFATKGTSLLEWILTALNAHGAYDGFAEIETVDEDELLNAPVAELASAPEAEQQEPLRAELEDARRQLKERLSFTYDFAHLTRLPAKLSVSKLSPTVLDVFDSDAAPLSSNTTDEGSAAEKAKDDGVDRLLHTFDRVPCFGKKRASAAERGTATHEFMQFCDLENAEKNGVEAELARLVEQKFLARETAEAVRKNELEAFFQSEFYRMLKGAKDIYRETRFHIFLPADRFTKDADFAERVKGERLAVQGVIDLFFTDAEGDLILCDYKTDRLSDEELRDPAAAARMLGERHGEQLSYYALALADICGKRPDKVLIYSLPLGEAVEIAV